MKNLKIVLLSVMFVSLTVGNILALGYPHKKTENTTHRDYIDINSYNRADLTLNAIYNNYSVGDTNLLRENFPHDEEYNATYLATQEQRNTSNDYSYLWPYSGTLSAITALYGVENNKKYLDILENKVLAGLEKYFDTNRKPDAYASYINSAPISDRFYDDNIWIGIDFTDLYMLTNNQQYLNNAKLIWEFVLSGIDDKLGGGIYWCEQKKESKNTCSNAPGSVYAFKLFEATGDSTYYQKGKELYEWTKKNLQDNDYLYFDNININGRVDKRKFAYNSGQMILSAALQYKLTKNSDYLNEAQQIAKACHEYFFNDYTGKDGQSFQLLKKGDVWFTAVMLRGFIELHHLDNNRVYLQSFKRNMDYAWLYSKDENGLFNQDFSGARPDSKKWLLTQAAIVEMYARLATLKLD